MTDKRFRLHPYQSERETSQYIGYQLQRIADALEQSNTQTTPLKCSFCDCTDPDAIQMQAVDTSDNMQPVCEYCFDKFQEASMEAAERIGAALEATDDDA